MGGTNLLVRVGEGGFGYLFVSRLLKSRGRGRHPVEGSQRKVKSYGLWFCLFPFLTFYAFSFSGLISSLHLSCLPHSLRPLFILLYTMPYSQSSSKYPTHRLVLTPPYSFCAQPDPSTSCIVPPHSLSTSSLSKSQSFTCWTEAVALFFHFNSSFSPLDNLEQLSPLMYGSSVPPPPFPFLRTFACLPLPCIPCLLL